MHNFKRFTSYVLLIVILSCACAFSSGCGKYSAKDQSAAVGTWRMTTYYSVDNGSRTNLKKQYEFYYFVFNEDGKGFMKFKEKDTQKTTKVYFSYACQTEEDELVSVSVSASGVTTTLDFKNNAFQKGTLSYTAVSETPVTFESGATETMVYKQKLTIKKISNDVDIIK